MYFEIWWVIFASCPAIQFKNMGPPFSVNELQTIERAEVTCEDRYPNSPCVISIEKRGFQNYYVVCGAKR